MLDSHRSSPAHFHATMGRSSNKEHHKSKSSSSAGKGEKHDSHRKEDHSKLSKHENPDRARRSLSKHSNASDRSRSRSPSVQPRTMSPDLLGVSQPSAVSTNLPPNCPDRPGDGQCWVCGKPRLPGKMICENCLEDISKDYVENASKAGQVISQPVGEHAQEPVAGPSAANQSDHTSASDDSELSDDETGFDFALVKSFVRQVKQALEWEDEDDVPSKSKRRRYYKHLNKKIVSFPLMEEIKDIVLQEWLNPVKKPSLKNRLKKLYPMSEQDAKMFEASPVVDASIMKLARNVTLPLEDAVSFRDLMDRQIDMELKRTYLAAGEAAKPVIALSSVAKACKVWTNNIETAVRSNMDHELIIAALDELKLAADFIGEVAVDTLRCVGRVMLFSTMAKRALWLKPWAADPSSKQSWTKIPYDGENLFGPKMDKAISRVTGGKSGLIPHDRKFVRQRFNPNRRQPNERFRDAKSYKPGRPFRRDWKGTQSSFLKLAKNKSAQSSGQSQKSF
ncbi:uncharacterized protein [Hyperolius riggenbachi]|uniref:uncharacterized protein n=1 Tax=Hyperolius riggenbachi TaxID=752182 RepID=UPI0035A3C761